MTCQTPRHSSQVSFPDDPKHTSSIIGHNISASFILAVGLAIQAGGVPFPAFVISYVFAGYGSALLVRIKTPPFAPRHRHPILVCRRTGRWDELVRRISCRRDVHEDVRFACHVRSRGDVLAAGHDRIHPHAALVLRLPRHHRSHLHDGGPPATGLQAPAARRLALGLLPSFTDRNLLIFL